MTRQRKYLLAIGAMAAGAIAACTKPSPSNERAVQGAPRIQGGRLIILGFDGVDPRRVDALVKAGKLPHVAELGRTGYRGPLGTTNPPQSPVAWAAFATGLPAGEHGIFDFIGRSTETYFPEIATTRVRQAEIEGDRVTAAEAENLRRGDAFWDVIARTGVPVRTLTVPYAYPPPPSGARSLAGLGAPDIRGTNSSFTLLTTRRERLSGEPPAGGQVALLEPAGQGVWQAMIEGPRVRLDGSPTRTETTVLVRAQGQSLVVELGGERQELAVGATGRYVSVRFVPSPHLTIVAATRVTVRAGAPAPELYLEPLSIHPEAPYLPLSNPPGFAQELWRQQGPFKTVGWIDDTSALGAGAIDEDQFLREAFTTMGWEKAALLATLRERKDKLIVAVATSPDRIGHMFYRYLDPEHPARDAKNSAYANALDQSYLEMDKMVGEARALLDPQDVLMVVSDHGFESFRRGLNLNRWLVDHGYMKLKRGVTTPRDFFLDVDWARTKAYALGTGGVFVNVKGRESQGSVDERSRTRIARAIAAQLLGVKDGKRGKIVLATYEGDALYTGSERRQAPDVRVALADGYRASWATSLGGIGATLFEDNTKKWSGDHASARPEDVPGILVTSRPLALGNPRIEDVSATAYRFTQVQAPAGTIGRALLP